MPVQRSPTVGALLLAGFASLGFALDAARAGESAEIGIAQLGIETWTPAVGLSGSWVRAIAQTPDGFLWLGTARGLSRFDGHTFLNLTAADEPAMPANAVRAFGNRSDGALWVGFDAGGVRVLERGRLRVEPELAALEPLSPVALIENPPGTLWIGTEAGLWRWRDGSLDNVAPKGVRADVEIRQLAEDPAAGLWARTHDDGLWRIEDGEARRVDDAPGCIGIDLAVGPGEHLITACLDGVWEREGHGAWTQIDSTPLPNRVYLERSGQIWIAATEGLRRRSGGVWELLPAERGLGDYRVRSFFEDAAGQLWIGAYSGGLSRFRRGAVTAVGAPEGLAIDGTTGVVGTAEGDLWIGTVGQGALRWRPGRGVVERWGSAQGLPTDWVYTIALDPARAGRVWLGTDLGLYEIETGRAPRLVERPEERTRGAVRLLYADPARPGALWVAGTAGGLDEISGGVVRRHDLRLGLGLGRVSELRRLRSGALLAAGQEGLFRYDGVRWREEVARAGTIGGVRTFVEAPDGTLWLAGWTSGLVRLREGVAVRYSDREGLPFPALFSLELDGAGGLWLSSDEGVARLRPEDFGRWLRGELNRVPVERLTRSDGLRDRECNGWGRPASWALGDSRLVYPTSHGVALVDPSRLVDPDLGSRQIYVDRAWTGERELGGDPPWRLRPKERHLRVRFGAIDFLRPDAVRFRHRLEGLERDWSFAGAQREVNYSYLPPGRYRFRLEARRPGRGWVEAATVAAVVVAPKVWESLELRIAALALLVTLAMAVYRWRTRVERKHNEAIDRERALLRDVIDTSPNPIFSKRRDLTYALANRAAAEVYGLEPADLVGRSERELEPRAAGMEQIDAIDREVLESGEERVLSEAKVVDAAGASRWFRVVKRPRRGPSGAVEQVVGTAVDVTDFKVAEQQLRRHEAELEASREELQRLARRLLTAQEEERRRLARELHDDMTQRLAGIAMLVGGLARALDPESVRELAPRIERLGEDLEVLAADTQTLSRDLHPHLLESLGLEDALRAECANFAERTGLRIPFASENVPSGLVPEVSLVLYRIAQEALRNALEHAGTPEIRVELRGVDGELRLVVSDAGVGFDPDRVRTGGGLGLASMAERARLIGSNLEVESAPGQGTRITVRVALGAVPRRAGERRGPAAPD